MKPVLRILLGLGAMAAAPLAAQSPAPPALAAPPPAGAVAPALGPLTEAESRAVLDAPFHCALRRDGDLILVAEEGGRRGVARVASEVAAMRFQERSAVRNGGRFVAASGRFDLWVVVDPGSDRSLARGLPRSVRVMVNGAGGGSDVFDASYVCNY